MGTWGTDIFDSDITCDVQDTFEEALETGASMAEATACVFEEYAHSLEDIDERPHVWLALAALQLEHGALTRSVRDHALAVIESGEDQRRWDEESTPEDAAERRLILAGLRARLLASQWYEQSRLL
jgi:hypothetical protein